MKKFMTDSEAGALVLWHCKCSVWPISPFGRIGRCGDCDARPQPIPEWTEEPE